MVEPYPVLPDDVIEDIFARLPAKAVYRFRCLSRTWAARLVSDDFADLHLRLANSHGVPKMLFLQDSISNHGSGKAHIWSPDNSGWMTLMEFPPSQRVQDRYTNRVVPYLVTQQCRGLVILRKVSYISTYYVLNPSTGRMVMLPNNSAIPCDEVVRLGLGYDSRTKKHKVVCIYYCCSVEKNSGFHGCDVYVINSATRDWRPVDGHGQKKQRGWINEHQESVFAQGHLHWLAKRMLASETEETFIFSFSLEDEKSASISLPTIKMEGKRYLDHRLTEQMGRLRLFGIETSNDVWPWAHRYHIWLFCGHDSCKWELHFRIDADRLQPKDNRFASLVGIVYNGRRIICVRAYERYYERYLSEPSIILCAYDPMTDTMENLLDGGGLVSNSDMVLRQAASYMESVASPGHCVVAL